MQTFLGGGWLVRSLLGGVHFARRQLSLTVINISRVCGGEEQFLASELPDPRELGEVLQVLLLLICLCVYSQSLPGYRGPTWIQRRSHASAQESSAQTSGCYTGFKASTETMRRC